MPTPKRNNRQTIDLSVAFSEYFFVISKFELCEPACRMKTFHLIVYLLIDNSWYPVKANIKNKYGFSFPSLTDKKIVLQMKHFWFLISVTFSFDLENVIRHGDCYLNAKEEAR